MANWQLADAHDPHVRPVRALVTDHVVEVSQILLEQQQLHVVVQHELVLRDEPVSHEHGMLMQLEYPLQPLLPLPSMKHRHHTLHGRSGGHRPCKGDCFLHG